MSKTILALALLSVCTLANAHFGSVIPDKQIVSDPKDSTLTITAAFNHPMEQAGMTMEKPKNFSVIVDGKKTDLTNTLQKTQVLNGKPAPDTMVEVEFYNVDHRIKAPSDIFITQQVKTDKNGVFSYAVPWEGWWGFAALNDADFKIKKDGQDKDVELGAVLWTEFVNPSFK